jgi:hypothetical protein
LFTLHKANYPEWSNNSGCLLSAFKDRGILVHRAWYGSYILAELMIEPRVLRVFVASPDDVAEERAALAKLLTDINDVLAYLAPDKRLSIELVRYETHSYPDIGAPQEVINREIPDDYDIFVGIMWKRAGTPTSAAASGTIEEFDRACERRKHGSLPRIMFYFCDQPIPMPTAVEVQQLVDVVKFRSQLASQGLTVSYPTHAEFSDHVRGGLLRAIRDILSEAVRSPASAPFAVAATSVEASSRETAAQLAKEYDQIRRDMPAGDERTRRMEGIFSRMTIEAPKVQDLLSSLQVSHSAGERLMAIAVLNMFPDASHLDWLADRMDPGQERPFVSYHAAVALLDSVMNLPSENCAKFGSALAKAKGLAFRLKGETDRMTVLRRAEQEFERKCGQP